VNLEATAVPVAPAFQSLARENAERIPATMKPATAAAPTMIQYSLWVPGGR
jgi:hypothetical protein